MTEQSITFCHQGSRFESVANVLGFGLSFSAVIAACFIAFFTKTLIPVENPAILVFASFFVLVPFKLETLSTLQKIIGFYLFSVLVNQLSGQYFPISAISGDINVSYSTIPLLLCGLGYFAGKPNSINTQRAIERANIFYAWELTLIIIAVHMVCLSLVLNKFYGYGYERNLSTAGNLALYLLLFIVLWEKLGNLRLRQSMGLVLAFFYLASIFMNN